MQQMISYECLNSDNYFHKISKIDIKVNYWSCVDGYGLSNQGKTPTHVLVNAQECLNTQILVLFVCQYNTSEASCAYLVKLTKDRIRCIK